MLNGEKYKEVCPDNTLLNNAQLRGCIIQPNHKKPLLKRESAMGVAEDTRIFLTVEVRVQCSCIQPLLAVRGGLLAAAAMRCVLRMGRLLSCNLHPISVWQLLIARDTSPSCNHKLALIVMILPVLILLFAASALHCYDPQHGQAPLSDLQCTTSSEALLCGKAPTFRLLVWAIDRASGTPVPNVTYVVSESFVVATKRVKHAIKSDIPSIGDHISKLVHIGKATVDKLQDIRQAAVEENLDLELPEELNRVDKVRMGVWESGVGCAVCCGAGS